MKIKLTKRNYTGKGYYYNFKNIETGLYLIESCSEEDYNKLALKDAVNPTKEGHILESAVGATVKVDTESGMLGDKEYCQYEDGYYVLITNSKQQEIGMKVKTEEIIGDEIDISNYFIWQ